MFHALKQNTHLKAALRTLGGIALFPWCPYFIVIFFMAENNMDEGAAGVVTFAWAIGSAVYQRMKTIARRARILRDLRILATGS